MQSLFPYSRHTQYICINNGLVSSTRRKQEVRGDGLTNINPTPLFQQPLTTLSNDGRTAGILTFVIEGGLGAPKSSPSSSISAPGGQRRQQAALANGHPDEPDEVRKAGTPNVQTPSCIPTNMTASERSQLPEHGCARGGKCPHPDGSVQS